MRSQFDITTRLATKMNYTEELYQGKDHEASLS